MNTIDSKDLPARWEKKGAKTHRLVDDKTGFESDWHLDRMACLKEYGKHRAKLREKKAKV